MPRGTTEHIQEPVGKAVKDFRRPGPPVNLLLDSLRDRLNGRMPQDELVEICYRWSFVYALEDMQIKTVPPRPSYYLSFLNMSENKRKKLWEQDSEARSKILRYLSEVQSIINTNRANEEWLRAMIKFFDSKAETLKVERLKEILGGYEHGQIA